MRPLQEIFSVFGEQAQPYMRCTANSADRQMCGELPVGKVNRSIGSNIIFLGVTSFPCLKHADEIMTRYPRLVEGRLRIPSHDFHLHASNTETK